ncbi:phosphoglycolate phosphatase [Rhodovulum imhoffii]|uniref:Phosphoglycolate phosphatase n=1 Tax=Rhodovulum imhoffii TaxID=365340 RepID=A0A2T5BS35_9RHOB|nr:HAD-IA family hydrolase [Rhodovulum imhoffii]MBK5932527.1 HAD family hydrolase [Rhodovulum imhoffii]PTN02061.1 phosphoglycolate phosphatase [Rhodovulum imhoffii]
MSDLRLVIFDVDGTLVDSQAHIHAAMAAAFDGAGLTVPDMAAVRGIVGLSLPVAIGRLAPTLDDAAVADLTGRYKRAFFDMRVGGATSPLFPGARDLLETLAAREEVLLGIATGKSRRGLDHLLAAHGLAEMFLTRQVADDHPSKPHPSMVLAALLETGVAACDAVMIGDTSFDMEMGRTAGVRTLGVGWGCHDPANLSADADLVVSDFPALAAAIEESWG